MRRRLAISILGVALTLLMLVGLGCSKGDYVPLLAPGGSADWPADPGWFSVPDLFGSQDLMDGVWDSETSRVVLVGTRGAVFEHSAGAWTRPETGLTTTLRAVAQLGPGEYLAVGTGGGICHGLDGHWQPEDSGSDADLGLVLVAGDTAWAVGAQGTVLRRQAGQWTSLPPAGGENLAGIAVFQDSVFVTRSDTSLIRVWDGASWGSVVPAKWASERTYGLVTNGDGHLYALADSMYVRETTGWRNIANSRLFLGWGPVVRTKVTGRTIWFGEGRWLRIDPTLAARQSFIDVPYSDEVLAPRDTTTYLTSESYADITWVEEGAVRSDPAGYLAIRAPIPLTEGGMLLYTDHGVVLHDGLAPTVVLDLAQIPLVVGSGFRAGCGHSPQDYYLAGGRALYHYSNGQAEEVGTWSEGRGILSMGITANNELYMGDWDGLWHWQGSAWVSMRHGLPDDSQRFWVWALGNGSLGASNENREFFLLSEGQWRGVDRLSWDAVLLAGADGTPFVLQEMSGDVDHASGNALLVLDERAGAFRNLWNQGMGPLLDLRVEGATSRGGEVLVWTASPAMVFTLVGPPLQADWRLVAGPFDGEIEHVQLMPDGKLLALDSDRRKFYFYQP